MSAEERQELLVGVRSSAHRLRRLTSDLATASRLHGETLELRLSEMSLGRSLHRAAARRETAEPGVHVDVLVPWDVAFRGDEERLDRALDNLLDNAVRHGAPPFTPRGDVGDDTVRIRVSDAGPGVPADLVPQLFQRFSHAGPSAGSGPGLYLVREIARGHGGEAAYRPPADGQPVTFELRLPQRALGRCSSRTLSPPSRRRSSCREPPGSWRSGRARRGRRSPLSR